MSTRARLADVPALGPRRLEKHIEAEIIEALHTLGFAVTKTSQPRPSKVTIGVPDLYATSARWGIRAWFEVKRPGNDTTPAQEAWHRRERLAGGYVFVVRSVGDVLAALRSLMVPV